MQVAEQGLQPKWSPNGRLALIWGETEPDYSWLLRVIDPTGALPAQQVNLGYQKSLFIDRWLDHGRLSLVVHRGTSAEDLVEVNILEGTITQLVGIEAGTLTTTTIGAAYHWSPELQFLVIERPKAVLPGQISLLEVATGAVTDLAQWEEPRHQRFEAWAPDTRQFLYEQWGEPNSPMLEAAPHLLVWDVATRQGRELLPNVWGAAWSSTDQIAFLLLGNPTQNDEGRIVATDFQPGQPFALFLGMMDATTQEVGTLLPLGQVTDAAAFRNGAAFAQREVAWCGTPRPVWSPDSSQLVYGDAEGRLWLLTAEGQQLRLPTSQHVAWSQDSKWLAIRTVEEVVVVCTKRETC
ncbi:MAG: hypothetical protein ACRDIB_17680 [Ardenticatenaceae bacterium]